MILSETCHKIRHRRLRQAPWLRELMQETRLHSSDLILPLFVHEAEESSPIASLPGVSRLCIKDLKEKARLAKEFAIPAVAIFPVVENEKKDAYGKQALNKDNLICRAIKELKDYVPEIGIIADVALDPYTTHGHDGVLDQGGDVDNDATVEILARQALLLAQAGADIVAPSDMMDARVSAIRNILESNGKKNTLILAYSAKYASSLYGPFRDAVGSATGSNYLDKRSYQMSPANSNEAMREIAADIAEGADMVMIKPALPYLDVISRAVREFNIPVLAYHVSGEYAMARAMPNYAAIIMESLMALKRAGTSAIFTYAALEIAEEIAKKI